ncbi:hypothetical protein COCSUDRAFT_48597 [Coccomyxa subellipsoidea C-169]|uniref:Uncharacterized protein n=1 Tax=Coccomyxa subellipsoidea (strain C-169) TaxID=574566 RepID=I0YNW1_COCSC|nr:hypothetical protein COCSUDRAFT_48597 [Coccomyxa subellipsoidea C-169]EIE20080.1 hypothetical protein COCSUDRAFT_48597 [Coccomyxa subellipsoidea C-169]|eukprot:XP_005644624.1 hypothetical protein COCSUDRAFT_48597 [Coccomyxa subellipsoidea C-169]
MITRLVKKVLFFPIRVLSRTYRVITAATSVPDVLPVGGLSGERASGLLFALRQDEFVAVQWLTSLQLAQIASDRLLHDVDAADGSLSFWSARLKGGAHRSFLLLGQGPTSFVLDCVDFLRGHPRRRLGALKQPNATDQIERRVILLRALRGRLCEALAKVHNGAAQLNLAAGSEAARSLSAAAAAAQPCAAGGPGGPAADESARLLAAAREAALHCVLSVSTAVENARRAAEELTTCPPEETHAETAATLMHKAAAVARALTERAARKLQRITGFSAEFLSKDYGAEEGGSATSGSPKEECDDEVETALERAAAVLIFESSATSSTSANAALAAAAGASSRRHGIIRIPEWLAAPSKYKQHWIRYSFIGLACFWSARFLYLHSPLAGSDDLEMWARSVAESVTSAYRDRVLVPLLQLKDELFATFRQRRSIVSVGEYETDKASLERMLRDFEADFGKASTKKVDPEISAALERAGAGAGDNNATAEGEKAREGKGDEGDELLPGMAFMMSCYEDELKKPIRNIVNGSLLRAILIQEGETYDIHMIMNLSSYKVQKLKLDTESAMLELDQILRANELTVAVVAAVPSLLIAGGTCYALFRWLTPSPPDRRSEALPARMAMVEVERTIHKLALEGTPELQGEVVWRVARSLLCWVKLRPCACRVTYSKINGQHMVASADQSTALLVAAANIIDGRVFPDYSLCTTSTRREQIRGQIISGASLKTAVVKSRWFGRPSAKASEFSVDGCQSVSLGGRQGRSLDVYGGSVTQGCKILVQSVGGGTCSTGQASSDQLSGGQLLYGLKATIYPDAYGADCNSSSSKPYGLPDFGGLQADPSLPQRCQDPSLMKAYGGVFPGSPPLDAGKYSKCYGMQLEGYVQVAATAGITSSSAGLDTSAYANRFRVCARYSGHAEVTLNGASLQTSSAGNYDATLVCHDVPYLPAGLLPLSVQFASGPNDVNNVFQLWVIPVKSVTQIAAPVNPGEEYQIEYACTSCCGLFGGSGDCCAPLDGCAFRTESCTPAAEPTTTKPTAKPPAAEPTTGKPPSATAKPTASTEPASAEPPALTAAAQSPLSATTFATPIAAPSQPPTTDIPTPATAGVQPTTAEPPSPIAATAEPPAAPLSATTEPPITTAAKSTAADISTPATTSVQPTTAEPPAPITAAPQPPTTDISTPATASVQSPTAEPPTSLAATAEPPAADLSTPATASLQLTHCEAPSCGGATAASKPLWSEGCRLSRPGTCCMYALQMAYYSSNGSALAVTNAATVPVAVVCNTSVPLSFQPSDFAVRGASAGANATVVAVADVTTGTNADITTAVVEISVNPAYEGVVSITFAASSVRSKKGPRVLVAAAQLTYTKQQAALPVMTTAAEYT